MDISGMTVKELQAELSKRSLPTSGRKAELQARLREAIAESTEESSDESPTELPEESAGSEESVPSEAIAEVQPQEAPPQVVEDESLAGSKRRAEDQPEPEVEDESSKRARTVEITAPESATAVAAHEQPEQLTEQPFQQPSEQSRPMEQEPQQLEQQAQQQSEQQQEQSAFSEQQQQEQQASFEQQQAAYQQQQYEQQAQYEQQQQQAEYGQQQAEYGQQQAEYGQQQAEYGQQQVEYGQQQLQTQYEQQAQYDQQQQYDAAMQSFQQAQQAPSATETKTPGPGLAPGQVIGRCKWYDLKKGFGFVQQSGSTVDVFVHSSAVRNAPGTYGMSDGQECAFTLSQDHTGRMRADHVTGVNGEPIVGQHDPMRSAGGWGGPAAAPSFPTGGFPSHTTGELAPGRKRGVCKWYDPKKGFGFVTPDDGTEDLFVHQSAVRGPNGLADGENVEFTTTVEPGKGLRAAEVTGPGGAMPVGAMRGGVAPMGAPMHGGMGPMGGMPPAAPYGGYGYAPPYGGQQWGGYGYPPAQPAGGYDQSYYYGGYPPQ